MRIRSGTFTDGARMIMFHSAAHARRLGHPHRDGEHFLLALAAADLPVAAVLRSHGVTPERVESEIVRLEGLGPGAVLVAGLDPDALAAVGVDLGAVRDRLEASFGAGALARAGQAARAKPRRPSGQPRGNPQPLRAGPVARWRRRGRAPAAGHIRPAPDAWYAVQRSVHEAMIRHDTQVSAEHLALAVTAMDTGLVPRILSALGTSAPALRAAILGQQQ